MLLNLDTPLEWYVQSGNPFKFEDWKTLVDWLSNGDKARNTFVDAGLLLNNPVNVTPIAKPKKSGDLFGVNLEPHLEPSHISKVSTFSNGNHTSQMFPSISAVKIIRYT